MEIMVEGKNKKYAELLRKDYTSKFSDLTSFLLYKYENYLFSETDSYFSKNMNNLSTDSLAHFEILGRLISMLGEEPDHISFQTYDIFYLNDKEKLLSINIRITKEKIVSYTKHLNEIDDKYIKNILSSFIVEERKNLKILEMLQLKYKKNHY